VTSRGSKHGESLGILAEELDISYRQLWYWLDAGYLPGYERPGTGYMASFTDEQKSILQYISRLVEAGFHPKMAAKIAVEIAKDGKKYHDLPGGVRVSMRRKCEGDSQREAYQGELP
jgi:DNA-binding transcriptional MerR regulator